MPVSRAAHGERMGERRVRLGPFWSIWIVDVFELIDHVPETEERHGTMVPDRASRIMGPTQRRHLLRGGARRRSGAASRSRSRRYARRCGLAECSDAPAAHAPLLSAEKHLVELRDEYSIPG